MSKAFRLTSLLVLGTCLLPAQASAQAFFFSTGNPNGLMATASRPGPTSGGNQETESADDFVVTGQTSITSATFTGLVPAAAVPAQVRVEIYRVFPTDSDVGRTSGPPTFSTPLVPTRVNSPSDNAFAERDSQAAGLSFTTSQLSSNFTAANSVDLGIHPTPGQTTGGDGQVSGQEVQFNVTFTTAIDLPADHYFFVPQVLLGDPNSHFYWLSAPKPIVSPGTSFSPDLQEWIRNAGLDPDWLRVGTDIVGGATPPTFNATFSLTGTSVTAATFASANATSTKRGVLLRWRTASEANMLGFRIYRLQAGRYRPTTRVLLPAKGAIAGAGYRYVDLRAPRSGLLHYRIQMIDRNSARSWFGPALLVRR